MFLVQFRFNFVQFRAKFLEEYLSAIRERKRLERQKRTRPDSVQVIDVLKLTRKGRFVLRTTRTKQIIPIGEVSWQTVIQRSRSYKFSSIRATCWSSHFSYVISVTRILLKSFVVFLSDRGCARLIFSK